ncbi:hypothetical protein [Lyngbya aestuarii]|uniref:hypothetical protein n=1 Tax=Lyngbya aestuarii TaxID=118322 RepID=UPI00403D718E
MAIKLKAVFAGGSYAGITERGHRTCTLFLVIVQLFIWMMSTFKLTQQSLT